MDIAEILILLVAGTAAGTINTVVGSGSLVTFPALLALGYPPVLANVTNNLGVLPGSVSGSVAYRAELRGYWRTALPLALAAAVGGAAGAVLLLLLPAEVFDGIVPSLIILALVLVVAGPRIKRWSAERRARRGASRVVSPGLLTATGLTGVYGGYFGAAQGVLLISILSIALPGSLHKANAVKNVLGAAANGAAAVVFVTVSEVAWPAAGVIALGAILGGQVGGRAGRRIPELVYRAIIVVIGLVAVVSFLVS
ncbi:sulfite exporter TauE/SafE family protein [Georgenia sp. AZ-5]|uniref:sulfite exporter TauE/SafE family protein n=1 Tax=Georgenia sp. AZ-5 TaxID=3367526 RepID=UPI003754CA6C